MREGESVHSDGAVAWVGDLVPGGRVRASPSGLARARGWGRMSVVGFPHQANAAPQCQGGKPRSPARAGPPHTRLTAQLSGCSGWAHAAGRKGTRALGLHSSGLGSPGRARAQ